MQHLDRRRLLFALAAASTATAIPAAARTRRTFFERIGRPLGLQVYTLGPDAGKDVDATFASIAAIGYREIELTGLLGRPPAQIAAAAARAGLAIVSLHVPLLAVGGPMAMTLNSDPGRLADTMGALGARWAVAPIALIPTNFRPAAGEAMGAAIARTVAAAGADIWKQTAEQLNKAASSLSAHGIKVGYHNHNIEFRPIGETSGWNILLEECDPRLVSFVRVLRRLHGRVRLLHVKDVAAGNSQSYEISMQPAEVGAGTIDWARVLPAAQKAGVQHYLVEQEPPFTIPRIEAAERSHRFLSQLRA